MSDDHPAAIDEINRARLDVLERTLALFMVAISRPAAEVIEDQLRSYIEHGVTSPDQATARKLRLADEAAVRFADIIAQVLATPRSFD